MLEFHTLIHSFVETVKNQLATRGSGECPMSAILEYQWEWPTDRTIEDRVFVWVEKIEEKKAGFLVIDRSPSLARSFPNPLVVSGLIADRHGKLTGKRVKMTVPKMELQRIQPGSLTMFGLIENDICICIQPVDRP